MQFGLWVCLSVQGRPPPTVRLIKSPVKPSCSWCNTPYIPGDVDSIAELLNVKPVWLCRATMSVSIPQTVQRIFIVAYDLVGIGVALLKLNHLPNSITRIPICHRIGLNDAFQTALSSQTALPLPPAWAAFCGASLSTMTQLDTPLEYITSTSPSIQPPLDVRTMPLQQCPPWRVRVVILGTRPYRTATEGIPFIASTTTSTTASHAATTTATTTPIPPALQRIWECLSRSHPTSVVANVSNVLASWPAQGVLMMNAEWTRDSASTKFHTAWHDVTTILLAQLARRIPHIIFVAWGHTAISIIKRAIPDHFPYATVLTGPDPGHDLTRPWTVDHFVQIDTIIARSSNPVPIQWT